MANKEVIRETFGKSLEVAKKIIHFSWIPLILYFGFTQSATRPNILKVISPFAA
jgi:import receptor subunit TOM7